MLRKILAVLIPWSGTSRKNCWFLESMCLRGHSRLNDTAAITCLCLVSASELCYTTQNPIFIQFFLFLRHSLSKWRQIFLSGKAQCLESPDSHNGPKSFAASCLSHSSICKEQQKGPWRPTHLRN